ncbi:MAG: ATP-dependent DNA helicase RecG [Terriglobia bacterium]
MPIAGVTLNSEVQYLKGVGPVRAELLSSRGIRTVEDLLYYTPFRYEDRTRVTPIRDLMPGQYATILGRVLTCGLMRTRGGMYIFDLSAVDASGADGNVASISSRQPESMAAAAPADEPLSSRLPTPDSRLPSQIAQPVGRSPLGRRGNIIRCKWFNAAYLQQNHIFRAGQRVFFYGKVERDQYGVGNLQIIQPQYEILPEAEEADETPLEVGRVVPIYESIGALTPRVLRRLTWNTLALVEGQIAEYLPGSVRRKNKLLDRGPAIRLTHFPAETTDLEVLAHFRTPPQVRMIFEEFFNVGARLALKHRHQKTAAGIQFRVMPSAREVIKRILPFHPTAAQKRVLREIVDDMCSPHPMNRLLQGEVGSGKTIVAVQAAILAIENGYQVALMAPTEILATQHYLYVRQLGLPYEVDLLVSARKASEKEDLKRRMATGDLRLVVGTHALLEEDVEFERLGLAVMDEQHRFGVMQRYSLIRKGVTPDVLVMSATPIPRTLALTLYGDLDVSVIDQLPPNRTPIVTRLFAERDRERAFEFMRDKLRAGEQAYVIYPLVEESEKLDVRAAVREYEHLKANVFPQFTVGLLHGRLRSDEKEDVMRRFKAGEVQILVATTVVEVGVDVPNATVMLIEHAERFGLAQLHQLRGRIGRGRGKSTCLLVAAGGRSEVAEERLRTMAETTDGFKIAEIDLKLRGPGDFFGTKQAGIPTFRIANLVRDQEILEWAKREADDFIEHPASQQEWEAFVHYLRHEWPRRYGLARVG